MLKGKKVLVTGAGGFIGSHVTEALVQAGANVTAMVRYSSSSGLGNLAFLPPAIQAAVSILAGNVEDSDQVYRAVEGQNIVLHLAALIAIPYSYVAPRSYVRTNVEGTLNILEAVRRHGTERVVITSTSEVYGTALTTPISEDHPLQGQSPYSASKIAADKLAEAYFNSYDTPVVILRPFNTFGPRQSARAFIPAVISQALRQTVIRLGSLAPERDLTFIADTVEGFIGAAMTPGLEGETINLGTGRTYSIGNVAHRLLELMGSELPIVHDEARVRPSKSEVLRLVSDNSKAARLMQWQPRVGLDEGLQQAIAFIAANPGLYNPDGYTL